MSEEKGTLQEGEYHPAANIAMTWLKETTITHMEQVMQIREALVSSAMSGNRLAEICCETWQRLDDGKPVSDRYVMGLIWTVKSLIDKDQTL